MPLVGDFLNIKLECLAQRWFRENLIDRAFKMLAIAHQQQYTVAKTRGQIDIVGCHNQGAPFVVDDITQCCLLYTSPSPRDRQKSRMPSSA